MRVLLFTILTFVSLGASAADRTCYAHKAQTWFDDDGKYQIRTAQTGTFTIVSQEHEDPYMLSFVDDAGEEWGKVSIMTGTLNLESGKVFQAVATITRPDGETAARLAIVGDIDAKFLSSNTFIEDPDTDFDPVLTVSCELK